MGPQGCGKGTQAELLHEKTNLTHVSIGDVLRSEVNKDSSLGNKVKKYVKQGTLIPEEINDELIKKILKENPKNLLLDGYPRDKHQLERLQELTKVSAVVYVDTSDEESVNRLSKRRICTATNEIFTKSKISEEDKQSCQEKGGKIIQREDDKPKAIKKRLKIFHKQTKPLVEDMKESGIKIIHVDGEQSIKEVNKEILEKLRVEFDQF